MQKVVALSVTVVEGMSGVQCVQDFLYVMRVLESIGLRVKKPMILEIDNKGAVDLANNWSVGGRTRHIETRQHFLRNLKEEGILKVTWMLECTCDVNHEVEQHSDTLDYIRYYRL